MITPEEIRIKAIRFWEKGNLLSSLLTGEQLFPWTLSIPKPDAQLLASHFQQIREGIALLKQESKETKGKGYTVVFRKINNQRIGEQLYPEQVVIGTLEDFLHLTGKSEEVKIFQEKSSQLILERPELHSLIFRKPFMVLDNLKDWNALLAVCNFFMKNPKPNLYLRQLEIPGVHTKFIESRKGLISELMENIMPREKKSSEPKFSGESDFEPKFGLKLEPPSIRLRILDPAFSIQGLTDLSVKAPELASRELPVKIIFIVENKMNLLSFPTFPDAIAIFGMGYGVSCLSEISWLKSKSIFYWGDIDTHGFSILDRVRRIFPETQSFLMDEKTFHDSKELWVEESGSQRYLKDLQNLSAEEAALFNALRQDQWGKGLRLEQERIGYAQVRRAVEKIRGSRSSINK